MNPMWVERLGWALIHFVWQALAIACLYAAARRCLSSPAARYWLACAALAAMMAAPAVTWSLTGPSAAGPESASRIRIAATAPSSISVAAMTIPLPDSVRSAVSGAQAAPFLRWVVMLWLAGAAVFCARLAGGWIIAARMRPAMARPAPPEWQNTLRTLGARIGLTRPAQLLISAAVQTPTVTGWLRPLVLAPVGALGGLPAEHLEALLLHELAHIRRHDYLVNLLQSVVEALLFYHPGVWWVSGQIRAERELCCDDLAVSVTGDAYTYARALIDLESRRVAHPGAALAANGGVLTDRIARLLGQPRPGGEGLGAGVLAAAILLIAAAYGLSGQSKAHPAFQSVTIKRNTSDWNERFRHPMGMGVNASLLLLIRFAYAPHDIPHSPPLPASQVAGGPSWIDSEGYDIDAKPAPNTDPKQIWPMWQTLLAERFKLRLHREIRELPTYHLTVAKGGPKLPPAKEAGCISFAPGEQPRHVPGKVDCGYVSGPFAGSETGLLHIQGRKVHVADLVNELALVLNRPVLDRTAFGGEFDLDLGFAPDESTAGLPDVGHPADVQLPNIAAALEQQLGLRLVPAKGPVEVLVIDHAERP